MAFSLHTFLWQGLQLFSTQIFQYVHTMMEVLVLHLTNIARPFQCATAITVDGFQASSLHIIIQTTYLSILHSR